LLNGWLKDVPPEHLEHEDPLDDLSEEKVNSLVESLARTITDKGMAFPASLILDIGRPLSFLASQGLLFTGPMMSPFISQKKVNTASAFLAKRSNIKKLVERLEQLHAEDVHNRKKDKLGLE
jgi:hypothetical protein